MDDASAALPRWGFAFPGPIRDELTALALAGTKTATTGLLVELDLDGEAVPEPGERSVLLDSTERPIAIIETVACRVVRLVDVDDAHAIDEGEGYADAAAFRETHERFWNGYVDDLRARLGDPSFAITDDTLVTAERLRVVTRLDVPPGPAAVRPVVPAEVPVLAGVLARAFARDPMVTWPLVIADDLPARIRAMFEAVDTPYAAEGWMFEAADGLGVMTLLPPGSSAREAELAGATAPAIAALSTDGGERYERFWSWTWSMLPDEPHWLLDQLAVEPDAQGRGIGGTMIRHAIDRADADALPLLLETAVPRNLTLYRRHGFEVFAEGDAPGGGPHVWFLRRDPGTMPGVGPGRRSRPAALGIDSGPADAVRRRSAAMTLATIPAMLGTEYLRLLEAKDEAGIFDLLAEDAQIVDEVTRQWVRGRLPIGAALRELFTRLTDIHSTVEDVHVMRWGDIQVETFTLHQVYDLDEASCWVVSPTTLIWHRIDHAWKLALMSSIPTDCA